MSDQLLPLNDVVRALRAEIIAASTAADSEDIRFQLGPIEVEFQVVAQREGGPNGTIKFGILGFGVELGGSAKIASEQTQKVKFSLTPVTVKAGGSRGQVEIRRNPTQAKRSGQVEISRSLRQAKKGR